MKFLIQTLEDKSVAFDGGEFAIKSIKYLQWWTRSKSPSYKLAQIIEDKPYLKNYVPVGSVEFNLDFYNKYFNKIPLPINVPECLFKYAGRKIFNGTKEDVTNNSYIKSNTIIKYPFNGRVKNNTTVLPGDYQISDYIPIDSEYRCFILNNELVGISNYSGDFTIFPNLTTVQDMILSYNNAPIAYTLDIGINYKGTFVIEVHDFFSCGVYGFNNHKLYLDMLYKWHQNFIKD